MSKLTGNQEFNGYVYLKGIAGYDGTNANEEGISSIQTVINELQTTMNNLQNSYIVNEVPQDVIEDLLYDRIDYNDLYTPTNTSDEYQGYSSEEIENNFKQIFND